MVRIHKPAGRFTSSYTAELYALEAAVNYIKDMLTEEGAPRTVRICCDSQSALSRLREGPAAQKERVADNIWEALRKIDQRHRIDLQWVPGHAGIEGNELADTEARKAAALPQKEVPINLATAKARLKLNLGREWAASNKDTRHGEIVGPSRIKMADRIGLSRAEGTTLARLRTGHSLLLRAYRHRIGLEDGQLCTDCEDGVPEDAVHLLTRCPATARLRHDIFGREDPTLAEVFENNDQVLSFLRRLGRLT